MTASQSRANAEAAVCSWGFNDVFTWTDANHNGVTTHLILRGQFTITYPADDDSGSAKKKKETFGPGDRVDVPAGKVHEVWIGDEGCTYVIGE